MIGRSQLRTIEGDDGSRGAFEHLIEVAEKKLNEAIAARNAARAEIRKQREEIRIRKKQLRAHAGA